METRKYTLVLFDLDGTLLDTSPGIFNSVRFAEQELGLAPIPQERLCEFVGPPPKKAYMHIHGLPADQAMLAAIKHRQYGREKGVYEAVLYPGIEDTLQRLKQAGCVLGVATLKAQGIAEHVLAHYGIAHYFDVIVGMDEQESLTKAMTIRMAMDRVEVNGKVCMVGDSHYDYEGAVEAKVDFLGVTYGFGFHPGEDYPFTTAATTLEIADLCL